MEECEEESDGEWAEESGWNRMSGREEYKEE